MKIMHYKTVNWRKLAVSISWLEFNSMKIVRMNKDDDDAMLLMMTATITTEREENRSFFQLTN